MAEEFDPDELLNSHYDEMQPSDYGLPADYNAQAAVKQAETTGLGSVVPTSMEDTDVMGAGKFVAEMTPIIGDAMAAKEVYDELQKDEPNYYLAGVLGGATIIGLIPGVGDAAANAIRAGAKSAGKLGGEVVGNTKALLQGDMDFIRGRGMPSESQGVGAEVVKQTDEAFGGASTATKLDNLFENMGEEGALAEFSSIGENINSYIMNVDNKALLNALSDPNMEAYRDVLQANLSEAFPTGKIKVTRIEGYADPSAKKTKKDFVVDAKDVFFVGNVYEKELIVRSRATGKPMSVRIQDDQSFSKVDKPKKEPVLEPVSTAASAYFPQKTTTAAVKQSVWEQAQMRPIKGFENITVDQLEKYKELTSDPDMEIGDVADYIRSINTNPDFDLNDESTFEILDSLAFDKKLVNTPTEYTFRSPIPDIANTVAIPQDGIRGADFLKELDRNPDVRNSEVAALDLEIEPTKRYTREELVAITNAHTYDTKAVIKRGANAKYDGTQRQVGRTGILDDTIQEVEYAEITINATRDENVKAGFKLEAGSHFGKQNMAHSRVSIVEDIFTRERSVLVEEVQTDMIQHGYIKPSPPVSKSQFLQDRKKEALRSIEELLIVDYAMRPNKPLNVGTRGFAPHQTKMFSDLLDYIAEAADTSRRGISPKEYSEKMKELSATYLEAFNVPTANTGVILGAPSDAAWATYPEPDLSGIAERLIKKPRTEWDADDRSIYRRLILDIDRRIDPVNSFVKDYEVVGKGVGSPPIKKIDEATRLSLLSAMSYAADNGVSKITIPNIERIVQKRFAPGSKQYNEAIKPGSGFHNTYVKSVDKFIKELQSNFGGNSISVSKIELPYKSGVKGFSIVNPTTGTKLSNEATVIDFSALIEQGYDLTKPRFAKGGVVTNTEKQMNNLFAEGGIKDDGMNVDPVSGNEVPSGSMASEVRDDIDAKLSEGEYVVPADVVRYFGVAFFEKLRAKAKEGLSGMESDGRIGGETPEDAEQDELPFDISELQVEDTGGVDSQMADIGMADGGMVHKYVEGGFQGKNWAVPGGSMFNVPQAPMAAITYKTYVNDAGQTMSIGFDADGKPLTPIPAGYRLQEPVAAVGPDSSPVAASSSNDDNGKSEADKQNDALMRSSATPTPSRGLGKFKDQEGNPIFNVAADLKNPDNWIKAMKDSQADLAKGTTGQKVAGAGAGLLFNPLASIIVGGIGVGYQAAQIAEMRAGIEIAKSQGIDDATITQMQGILADTIKGAPNAVQNMVREGSGFASGTNYAKRMMEDAAALTASGGVVAAPKVSTAAKASGEAVVAAEEARKTQAAAAEAAAARAYANRATSAAEQAASASRSSDRQSAANIAAKEAGSKSNRDNNYSVTSTAAARTKETSAAPAAKAVVEKYGTRAYRAKGGLMTKKKK